MTSPYSFDLTVPAGMRISDLAKQIQTTPAQVGDEVGYSFFGGHASSQGSVVGFDILTRVYTIRHANGNIVGIREDDLSKVCSVGYR